MGSGRVRAGRLLTGASFVRARLVPELLVEDLARSLMFWRDLCGFVVAYDRPEEGFAYLDREGAQIMLDEIGHGRSWVAGELRAPFGRGVNFEIAVAAAAPLLAAFSAARWPLFMDPEEKWYRAGAHEVGVRQFVLQDPDGYMIRFSERLGERPPLSRVARLVVDKASSIQRERK